MILQYMIVNVLIKNYFLSFSKIFFDHLLLKYNFINKIKSNIFTTKTVIFQTLRVVKFPECSATCGKNQNKNQQKRDRNKLL